MSSSVPCRLEDSRKSGTIVLKSRGLLRRHGAGHCGRATKGSVEYSVVLAMVCLLALAAVVGLGRAIRAEIQDANEAWSSDTYRPSFAETAAGFNGAPAGNRIALKAKVSGRFATITLGVLALGGLCGVAFFFGRHSWRRCCRTAETVPNGIPESEVLKARARLYAKRQDIFRMLHSNGELVAANKLVVRHVSTPNPITVSPGTRVKDITQLMEDNRWHHVLVCGTGRELLGVITDRDLRGRCGRIARQIMTPKPSFVSPDTPLGIAITHLVARQISCLPVVHAGQVCGILTTTDLAMAAHALLQISLRLPEGYNPADDSTYSDLGNEDELEGVYAPPPPPPAVGR